MTSLLDESDSEHSHKSLESDEESVLPSFVSVISSPPKRHKIDYSHSVPVVVPPALSPSKYDTGNSSYNQIDSPLRVSHSHNKAIKKNEKLSKKMRQLSESGKVRKDTAEKLEKYKLQGGILGLDKELQEQLNTEEDPIDEGRTPSIDSEGMPLTDIPKQEADDNAPPLPVTPPGRPLFVNQPSLINELYPPFAELAPLGSVFDGVERVLLNQDTTEGLSLVITSQWLRLCYQQKSCPLSVWQWLFQIMCRSCDQSLVHGAYVNLVDLVSVAKLREDLSSVYCPSMDDVTDILICLGMNKERLYAKSCPNLENDEVFSSPQPPIGNVSRLLLYLKVCVQTCPQKYSMRELEAFIVLLANVALDPLISQELVSHDISLCLSFLVAAIPAKDWACSVDRLASELCSLSTHHHNKLHLTRLITGTTQRLSDLQRLLCRKNIESLIGDRVPMLGSQTDTCFASKVLEHYYLAQSPSYDYEMCYGMNSLLTMLALFLDESKVVWSDTAGERKFALLLGALSDKVRDHPNHPERGTVKDLLIRMKLEYDGQNATKRQQGIKDYFN